MNFSNITHRYGNIAVRCDRYNACGLVNRGNVEFANALHARRKGSDRDFLDSCEHALQLYVAATRAVACLARALVSDALQGVLYVDDAQVVRETVSKIWGERCEVHVIMSPWGQTT